MIRTKRTSNRRMLDEINITPFCDVLLVLLIIFMVTAQTMTHEASENIQLPKTSAQETTFPKILTVKVDKDQQITINDKLVTLDALGAKIKEVHDEQNIDTIIIRADRSIPYQLWYSIVDIARQNGIVNITLPGELPGEHSE